MQATNTLWCLLALVCAAQGYEEYSPASMCTFGYPHHGKHRAQTSACPVTISVNTTTYTFNDRIQVNISGFSFEGLVFRSRSETLDWTKPLGSFIQKPGHTRSVTWYNIADCCITHDGEIESDHLEFVWQATGLIYPPTMYFVATIADGYETFWINCTSPSITFTGGATTPSLGFPEQAVEQSTAFNDGVCGNGMKCMRYPNNCDKSKNCEAIIAYKNNGTYSGPVPNVEVMIFEMWVKDAEWVSLAFSSDRKMSGKDDGDSVLFCGERAGRRTAQVGWNANAEDLLYQIHANDHVVMSEVRRDGNEVSCTIAVYTPYDMYVINDRTGVENIKTGLDYWNKEHCYFIGFGEFFPDSPQPMKHVRMPVVSKSCKQKLSTATEIEFRAVDLFIQSHAAMSTLAWLFLITSVTVLARHKSIARNRKFRRTFIWFLLHQVVIYVGGGLMVLGVILAFVFRLGWSTFATPHSVLGLVVTAITLAQFIIAWARPGTGSSYKNLFIWTHRILSILSIVLAFITEMVAVTMPSFPRTVQVGGAVILVFWFLVVLGVEIFLELQARNRAVSESGSYKLDMDGSSQEHCGGRKTTLICFIFMIAATLVLSFALIGVLAAV